MRECPTQENDAPVQVDKPVDIQPTEERASNLVHKTKRKCLHLAEIFKPQGLDQSSSQGLDFGSDRDDCDEVTCNPKKNKVNDDVNDVNWVRAEVKREKKSFNFSSSEEIENDDNDDDDESSGGKIKRPKKNRTKWTKEQELVSLHFSPYLKS
jgi:hypothetical protein